MSPWSTAVLASVVLLFLWWLQMKWKQTGKTPIPPGPVGLPILGSLLSLDAVKPHQALMVLANRYAKNGMFSLKLGSLFTVVLIDPNLMKEAFNKDVFSMRPVLYFTDTVLKNKGIISAKGALWKDQRKLLSNWMRLLGAARAAISKPRLVQRLKESADILEIDLRENHKNPIDLSTCLSLIMGNTINEFTYGINFSKGDPLYDWLIQIQKEATEYIGVAGVVNFLPFLSFFSPRLRKIIQTIEDGQKQTHKLIDGFIALRKKRLEQNGGSVTIDKEFDEKYGFECKYYTAIKNGPPSICPFVPSSLNVIDDDCVMDFYLMEQDKRKLAGDTEALKRISDEQMKFFICDVFGAALDTTLNSLLWFILYLAIHQEEQEKVRNELLRICGDQSPTLEHMSCATYTRAAMCEIQRIRTIIPLGVPHGTAEDTTLGGYRIPKGTMMLPFLWYIHNDPTVWEKPEEFRPSRFIGPDGSLLNFDHFMPFQTGKRMCPGDEFSKMMMFMYGTRLIHRFHISLAEPIPSLDGVLGLTLSPPDYLLKLKPL